MSHQADEADFAVLVGPVLASALEKKGFTELMPVQRAVLDPDLAGRDLRISSQTGSGKTIAIGLALRDVLGEPAHAVSGVGHPRALVVAPTRELAKQVALELGWLYAPLHARVATATGGADHRDERRSFAGGPAVVVGTPGRLLDHLNRGSLDPRQVGAVVLDEADRMLDLGFREELEAILAHAPPGHRTHLVSATFPREVRALADRVQDNPAHIEGTPLGTANADIDHLVHLVSHHDRVGAIINLLLATPGAQTLVFARTRADVATIARELGDAGFQVRALSGEMEQRERNLALAAFKNGTLHALVATDVAARGIDVQDIARVVHAEPPTDADSYTHRSGRTGRAGRKGTSSVLVTPAGLARTSALLHRTGVRFRIEPIPSASTIRHAADERFFAELTQRVTVDGETKEQDPRLVAMAERLVAAGDVVRTLVGLLGQTRSKGPEPRDVRVIAPPDKPSRPRHPAEARVGTSHAAAAPSPRKAKGDDWVPFRFTWGKEHGAEPRRLLAMACRRGGIRANDIGAIHIARKYSIVQIARSVAPAFAQATQEPDARDPRVTIRQEREHSPERPSPTRGERVEKREHRGKDPRSR